MRVAGLVLGVFVSTTMVAVGQFAAPVAHAQVQIRPDEDRYVGTGGLLLPGAVDQRTREEVASCRGCRWRLAAPCEANPTDPTGPCRSVSRGCPAGRELLRIWFEPPQGGWQDKGVVCVRAGEVVTVEQVESLQRETFERRVPALQPECWPPQGIVTNLPVVCRSGQSGERIEWTDRVLGWTVRSWVEPVWRWDFGTGTPLVTRDPGGPYPNMAVAHTFREIGPVNIEVQATWSGQYTVDGVGTYSLQPLRQERGVPIDVEQARGVLTLRR